MIPAPHLQTARNGKLILMLGRKRRALKSIILSTRKVIYKSVKSSGTNRILTEATLSMSVEM